MSSCDTINAPCWVVLYWSDPLLKLGQHVMAQCNTKVGQKEGQSIISTIYSCSVFVNHSSQVLVNPQPKGYSSHFVVRSFVSSFILSICPPHYREKRSLLCAS